MSSFCGTEMSLSKSNKLSIKALPYGNAGGVNVLSKMDGEAGTRMLTIVLASS